MDEAVRRWENRRDNRCMAEVRTKLEAMASGLTRCMYCEDSLGTDIDHFWPKAKYPNRTFVWENHLLACSYCNSNVKRDCFPLDTEGAPLLIDPTVDDPAEHLTLTPSTGKYRPRQRSPKGSESIDVFGLNARPELVKGRRNAWGGLQALIIRYGLARRTDDHRNAKRRQREICEYPFSSVLGYMLMVARSFAASRSLDPDCLTVLAEFPEIYEWV